MLGSFKTENFLPPMNENIYVKQTQIYQEKLAVHRLIYWTSVRASSVLL